MLSLDCIVTGAMVPRLYATCSSAALRSKIETAEVVIFETCLDLVCWFADYLDANACKPVLIVSTVGEVVTCDALHKGSSPPLAVLQSKLLNGNINN